MTLRRALITATGVMMLTAGPFAQQKTTENTGKALTSQTTMTGEVVLVDGNNLLVRMQPGSQYRIFNVPAERQFIIDGKPKTVRELTPGTVLSATVTTTAQPEASHDCGTPAGHETVRDEDDLGAEDGVLERDRRYRQVAQVERSQRTWRVPVATSVGPAPFVSIR